MARTMRENEFFKGERGMENVRKCAEALAKGETPDCDCNCEDCPELQDMVFPQETNPTDCQKRNLRNDGKVNDDYELMELEKNLITAGLYV